MKRFQQITAVILILILSLGTAVYAYPVPQDVKGTEYEEVMTTLSALGILEGRDTGEFDPTGSITRAEFAAVVIRATGLESSVQTAEYEPTAFDDCGDVAWAWGYINLATDQGIIEGYGDRNFGPNDPVTYEQAVAMLVRVLGYETRAQEKGGWTIGYIAVADEIKLTEGIDNTESQPAARGIVAQLTFKALEIPLCDTYSNVTDNTLLKDKLLIDKKSIKITSTDQAALEGEKNTAGEFSYREEKEDGGYSDIQTAKTEDSDTATYLGYSVMAYFKNDQSTGQNIAILLWPKNTNNAITVEASKIKDVSISEFQYKENGTTEKLNITNATILINGTKKSDFDATDLKPDTGTVTLIDSNGDAIYETIFIQTQTYQYAYVIHSSVSSTDRKTATLTLYTQAGEKIISDCNEQIDFNGESGSPLSENGECIIPQDIIVEYQLDGTGNITSIRTAEDNTTEMQAKNGFSLDYANENASYDNNGIIGDMYQITSDTVIFIIPFDESGNIAEDGIEIGSKNNLRGHSKINVSLYDLNTNNEISMMVYRPTLQEASYSPVSIVVAERVGTTQKPGGVTAQRVYGMENGKQVQLLTKNDEVLQNEYSMEQIEQEVTKNTGLTPDSDQTYEGATYDQWVMSYQAAYQNIPGSIILYTKNAKNEINYAYKVFPANSPDYIQWENGKSSIRPYILRDDNFGQSSQDRRRIIAGVADGSLQGGKILTFDQTGANSDFPIRFVLPDTANTYVIETGIGEVLISNGSISEISEGDIVVIHEYDDEVKDIFIYKNFNLERLFQ